MLPSNVCCTCFIRIVSKTWFTGERERGIEREREGEREREREREREKGGRERERERERI